MVGPTPDDLGRDLALMDFVLSGAERVPEGLGEAVERLSGYVATLNHEAERYVFLRTDSVSEGVMHSSHAIADDIDLILSALPQQPTVGGEG